jgi:acyl-CoA thioesterase-1
MTCPANVAVTSPNGQPMVVTYPPPTVTGGTAPVTTTCAPASDTVFPIGASPVQCSTADAQGRRASCSFTVTVSQPPSVSATRYLAFGDSITVGENGQAGSPPTGLYQPLWIVAEPYPAGFNRLMRDRYTAQTVTVFNRGLGGETTTAGLARLPSELSGYQPQVLLLLEGANDIAQATDAAVNTAATNLDRMVTLAKGRGVTVFLATLTPQREGGRRAWGYKYVDPLNARIKQIAAAQGVVLVDLFAAFGGQPGTLIDEDGLHPNQAGFTRMAETFYAEVRKALERPATQGAPMAAPFSGS